MATNAEIEPKEEARDAANVVPVESVEPDSNQESTEPTQYVVAVPHAELDAIPMPTLPAIEPVTTLEQAESLAATRKKVGNWVKSVTAIFKNVTDGLNEIKTSINLTRDKKIEEAQAFYDQAGETIDEFQREQKRLADAAAAKKTEDSRTSKENALVQKASVLESAGHVKAATEIVAKPVVVGAVAVKATKVAGFRSKPAKWAAQVTDETAFYKALAENPALRIHAPIDLKSFKAQAKQYKDAESHPYPGIGFYDENA